MRNATNCPKQQVKYCERSLNEKETGDSLTHRLGINPKMSLKIHHNIVFP